MTTTSDVTTFEQDFLLPASTHRVFAALTDAAQLRIWFAEHVSIEPRAGGAYRFWGRYTPWVLIESDATQTITALTPNASLAFRWSWAGSNGDVSLALAPSGEDAKLHVRHVARGPILSFDESERPWVLKDFWTLSIGNLREYLITGRAGLRPDFSQRGGDVVLSININAPASAVWKALTDPSEMDRWLSKQARVSLKEGGEYSYGWLMPDGTTPMGPMRLLEIEPGKRLMHDWSEPRDKTTRTEWHIEPLGPEKTKLTVRQIGTADIRESSGYATGWAQFLLRAKALLEGSTLF